MQAPPHGDDLEALHERQQRAFVRRQRALLAVTANLPVYEKDGWRSGTGAPPSPEALEEFRAADAEWRAAWAACERADDEIDFAG
jgi:hypothetical protein